MSDPQAHFIDTSALVKRYFREAGSRALTAQTFRSHVRIVVASLTYAEVYATVTSAVRDGRLTHPVANKITNSFEEDWRRFIVVDFGEEVRRAVPRHAAAHPLRGADLVQYATASLVFERGACGLFVVSDGRLINAAHADGLPYFDPTDTGS